MGDGYCPFSGKWPNALTSDKISLETGKGKGKSKGSRGGGAGGSGGRETPCVHMFSDFCLFFSYHFFLMIFLFEKRIAFSQEWRLKGKLRRCPSHSAVIEFISSLLGQELNKIELSIGD